MNENPFFPHNIDGDLADYKKDESKSYNIPSKGYAEFYTKIVDKNSYRINIIFCELDFCDSFFNKHYISGDRLYTFYHEEIQDDKSRKIIKIKRWKENSQNYKLNNNKLIKYLNNIVISFL